MRVVKASEMQEMDRLSIQEFGIPGAVLMENAARGASRVFLEHFNPEPGARVLMLCGSGNNGGDGYVMARYLSGAGLKTEVIILTKPEKVSGDALINLNILRNMGLKIGTAQGIEDWAEYLPVMDESDYIIDGILGTGLNSPVRGLYQKVIEDINKSGKPITAIDIPSGLNSDTGLEMGSAIKADLTITFGYPKIGQVVFPGAEFVGRLVRIDIGIPNIVSEKIENRYHIIEPEHFRDILHIKKQDIHKGSKGHLLILAGSRGKTGAAILTALGALKTGSGLVTLGIPESLNSIIETRLTEAMTEPLPETQDGSLSGKAKEKILRLIKGKTAIAIGPGLSTNPETTNLVRELVSEVGLPMIIDADGLNALAEKPESLKKLDNKKILTPHPGEMGRLLGIKSSDIQSDRVGVTERFARDYQCHLVLKGARTLICGPDGNLYINTSGNPALASGGTGDVLTGMIAGFLARKLPVFASAIAAVNLHGLVADLLSEDMGETGVLASELTEVIPILMDSIASGEYPIKKPSLLMDLYQPL